MFQKKSTEPPRVGFVFTGQGAQWSTMGKSLVENFPTASLLLKHLDDVLQSTPNPPSWSLLKELVEPRSPELLRSPEFSQPLVTALQLALMAILEDWEVTPQAVVGHSSGELAAACAAGYLRKEDALKAAFYRGQAAKNSRAILVPVGMLAVGLGPEAVASYIEKATETVQIACLNSPNSVTLSGALSSLEEVKSALVADGHFARMLQVNLAYHSRYMTEIGADYERLLEADFENLPSKQGNVTMYSSVFGREMDGLADASYWKTNMVSPVMFDQAAQAMVSGKEGADFLIEIGPSNALAGPVKQILAALGSQGSNVQYCTALSRGQDSIKSIYDVAGRLYASDGVINLAKVNTDMDGPHEVVPSVIVDLPNYSWNQSNEYWYESEASKDWRNRMFGHHDLLGSKVLATSWHTPAWKKTLRVADLPWLKDHKMGPEIVFPAAGFMAMAVEAIHQCNEALTQIEGKKPIDCPRYRLRDVTFNRALVLEEGEEHKIMLALNPVPGGKSDWHEFAISSLIEGVWKENSRGLVRVEEEVESKASEATLKPLTNTTHGQMWYKAMNDAGYNFGPKFQKQLAVESVSGERTSRSLVSFAEPESKYSQSYYPIHPAVIDGCLQTSAPSLWKGNRSAVNAVLVPAIIDEVIITSKHHPGTAISDTNSQYVGLGRREESKSYMSNASVYDAKDGSLLFRLSGLRYHKLDTQEDPYAAHTYSRVTWKPDITYLSQEALDKMAEKAAGEENHIWKTANELIDLVAHKKPNVKVMEANMMRDDSSSAWLNGNISDKSTRAACVHFQYTSLDANALITAQEEHEGKANTQFSLLDISKSTADLPRTEDGFDLVIIRMNAVEVDALTTMCRHAKDLLSNQGQVLFIEHSVSDDDFVSVASQSQTDMAKTSAQILKANGFHNTRHVPCEPSNGVRSVTISRIKSEPDQAAMISNKVSLVRFSDSTSVTTKLANGLRSIGWELAENDGSFESITPKSTVLVMDDLSSALFPTIREDQWEGVKALTQLGARILWVTEGSQLDSTHPERAMAHGLFRTVRSEDPSVSVTTLDVEKASGAKTLGAIDTILKSLRQPSPKTHIENEFVERDGIISVCRILPDHRVNHAESEDRQGADLRTRDLHQAEAMIRMQCERPGTIDSLCYNEVGSNELPLPDGCVEVEIAAAGLNFKDIAITMGIIPENQHLLGLEGAGIIRRVGKSASQFSIGQRVLVFKKGTFGNRIIATTERTCAIPDSMTFEVRLQREPGSSTAKSFCRRHQPYPAST